MNLDFLIQHRGEKETNFNVEEFQKELSNKLREMEERYTIDRFEGNFAICENRETGEMISILKKDLPKDCKEGTVLKINEANTLEKDEEEQRLIEKRIQGKMNQLWE